MERKTLFINERAAKREAEKFAAERGMKAWIDTRRAMVRRPDGSVDRGAYAYLHPADGSTPFPLHIQ